MPRLRAPVDTAAYRVGVRPLKCEGSGRWVSHDGRWTFLRHESDPHPKRWFIYEGDDREPAWFDGSASLSSAVRRVTFAVQDEGEEAG